jgi:hypothetical protein
MRAAARRTPGPDQHAAPRSGPRTPTRSGPRRPQGGLETPPPSTGLRGTRPPRKMPGGLLRRPGRPPAAHRPPDTQPVNPPAAIIRTPVPGSRHGRRSRALLARRVPPSGAARRTGVRPDQARHPPPRPTRARQAERICYLAGTTEGGPRPVPRDGLRRHPRPTAKRPRPGRTPGAGHRRSGPATRSRAAPGRPGRPAPARGPADRCGVRVPSGRPGRAAVARSAVSRPPQGPLTRCTPRASSRRGTRRSCAPRPGAPTTARSWVRI